jgi:hypothetical protein
MGERERESQPTKRENKEKERKLTTVAFPSLACPAGHCVQFAACGQLPFGQAEEVTNEVFFFAESKEEEEAEQFTPENVPRGHITHAASASLTSPNRAETRFFRLLPLPSEEEEVEEPSDPAARRRKRRRTASRAARAVAILRRKNSLWRCGVAIASISTC